MGFFKFLKREKKEAVDELDLPPAPPPLEGFEENLPDFPNLPDFDEQKISIKPEDMPKFDFLEEEEKMPDLSKEEPIPDLESVQEMEQNQIPSIAAPEIHQREPIMPQLPEDILPKPIPIKAEPEEQLHTEQQSMEIESHPKAERKLFAHEKRPYRMSAAKTVYVRVDKFKATLGSVNIIRNDLRKSEEALMKLETIKISKDRSFDKVKSSLEDLQKKLIFIDKTLFKGE
ncbi:hypothetical protein HYY70_05855 [Candidatus Woesearchaeota archaeon]|nr:hypothetical protein [Candidatus Woesearchaeota archaeon]